MLALLASGALWFFTSFVCSSMGFNLKFVFLKFIWFIWIPKSSTTISTCKREAQVTHHDISYHSYGKWGLADGESQERCINDQVIYVANRNVSRRWCPRELAINSFVNLVTNSGISINICEVPRQEKAAKKGGILSDGLRQIGMQNKTIRFQQTRKYRGAVWFRGGEIVTTGRSGCSRGWIG